jgi:hypothetical protein
LIIGTPVFYHEALGSNLGSEIVYTDSGFRGFRGFLYTLQAIVAIKRDNISNLFTMGSFRTPSDILVYFTNHVIIRRYIIFKSLLNKRRKMQ